MTAFPNTSLHDSYDDFLSILNQDVIHLDSWGMITNTLKILINHEDEV